jgi:hypothetical protein
MTDTSWPTAIADVMLAAVANSANLIFMIVIPS